ncbi:MAG: hypothetical protein WCF23_01360 [Candidatus Nitrosopolaris sp.]
MLAAALADKALNGPLTFSHNQFLEHATSSAAAGGNATTAGNKTSGGGSQGVK